MIESFDAVLPHGITLNCRASGRIGAPLLVFLHGFPEAAFVWDEMLAHFGDRYRCVAPNLRGFGPSSSPLEIEAYRIKHLTADLDALIAQLTADTGGPLEALIAHDWGGAVAWTFAALKPERMKRLVIINSPHPATFLRELQHSAAQQAASAYMNFLCRPDAEALLAANDFARLWPLFANMGALDARRVGGGWLTEPVRERYREIWRAGLTGGCNYYRASPLRPPTWPDDPVMQISFAPEYVTVPQLRLVRVAGATHWIVHERPAFIAAEIERFLGALSP
jgi:pimeloyl-ACP methyl ester carboxylesterase